MKFCLFSAASTQIKPMVDLTMPNKWEYCERHGYDFVHPPLTDEVMRGFERLPAIIELLKSDRYDWIWVLGCDALITNFNIRLESIVDDNYGMIVTADALRINLDSYLVRKDKGGVALLETLLEYKGRPIGGCEEQSTMDALCDRGPLHYHVRKVVPQRVMNSYRYGMLQSYGGRYITGTDSLGLSGEWQPGDFVFHCPGVAYETKMAALREMLPLILKD